MDTFTLGQSEEGLFRKGLFTEPQVQRKVRRVQEPRARAAEGMALVLEGREPERSGDLSLGTQPGRGDLERKGQGNPYCTFSLPPPSC